MRSINKTSNYQTIENRVNSNDSIFYVKKIKHSIGEVEGVLAICYNPKKEMSIRESLLTELIEAEKSFITHSKLKDGLQKFFSKEGKILKKETEKYMKFKCFSMIFTARLNLTSNKIIRMHFDKELIEKNFRVLKGIVKLRPIRHWLSNRVTAHVFVCYLSYLILSIFQHKVKSIGISATKAQEELEMTYKIINVKNNSKIDNREVTQTKFQQIILKLAAPELFLQYSPQK